MQVKLDKSMNKTVQILATTRTFRGISEEIIQRVVEIADTRTVDAGDALFKPGDSYKKEIYILTTGAVVMHRPSGRQDMVMPGDLIGLANYLDKNPYLAKTVATIESEFLVIAEEHFQKLEEQSPELFNALNRVIAAKLRARSPDRSITTGVLAQPVSRVMKSPVATCLPTTMLGDAFSMMQKRKIGSLVITEEDGRLNGILTYTELSKALLSQDACANSQLKEINFEAPRTLEASTALWEAEEMQNRLNTKYLIVLDKQFPLGIVSQTDILRVLISRPSTMTNRFREAKSIGELAELTLQLIEAAQEARDTHHLPSSAVRLLSEYHLIVQRRVVELTLITLEERGNGKAPLSFAVLIMGSGGRLEMLLNPDQDNGIILADSPENEKAEVKEWFDLFCNTLNRNLDRVGYPLCPGAIMARNSLYHKPLEKWKKQVSHIADQPTKKAAQWSNVVFDFDTLYGDDNLASELRRHALSEFTQKPRLLKMMADHDAEGGPALGFFNQLVTTKGDQGEHIDIKRNGLRIISDAARIFSLQNGVAAQNTIDRLNALVRVGKISEDFKDSIQEAFEALLDLLLSHQIKQAKKGQKLDKLIDPEKLSRQSRSTLRMAMRAVKRFQEKLQDDYATDIF